MTDKSRTKACNCDELESTIEPIYLVAIDFPLHLQCSSWSTPRSILSKFRCKMQCIVSFDVYMSKNAPIYWLCSLVSIVKCVRGWNICWRLNLIVSSSHLRLFRHFKPPLISFIVSALKAENGSFVSLGNCNLQFSPKLAMLFSSNK